MVKSPDLGSNLKIDFSRSTDTDFDASWREKYNGVFSFSVPLLDKKLYAIHFFREKRSFLLKPTGSLSVLNSLQIAAHHCQSYLRAFCYCFQICHRCYIFLYCRFLSKMTNFWKEKCHFPTKSTIVHEPAQLITQTQMSRFSAWLRIELSTWTSSAHHLNSAEPAQLMAQN